MVLDKLLIACLYVLCKSKVLKDSHLLVHVTAGKIIAPDRSEK